MDDNTLQWKNLQKIKTRNYKCGFCGNCVSSHLGLPLVLKMQYSDNIFQQVGGIYICPSCSKFTELIGDSGEQQFPMPKFGNEVKNLPESLNNIYNEARNCFSMGCFTACVMLCRKALMHISHNLGAISGESFAYYVTYLEENGFLPPKGRSWVDSIRKKGNQANHEIHSSSVEESKDIIELLEMLLKFNYEYLNKDF